MKHPLYKPLSLLLAGALFTSTMTGLAGCGSSQSDKKETTPMQYQDITNQETSANQTDTANQETDTTELTAAASQESDHTKQTLEDITSEIVTTGALTHKEGASVISDFGVQLLQKNFTTDKNTLISPLSVISAMAMTANGSAGNTRAQLEQAFQTSSEQLSSYLSTLQKQLPQGEQYRVSLANSIWMRDDKGLTVEQAFLEKNKEWFGAGVYQEPFNARTVKKVNSWVKDNTHGMIPSILSDIPDDAMLYLINALAFEAEWASVYHDYNVQTQPFHAADGTIQDAEIMHSQEDIYLQDEHATGFLKYYADEKYAFAALLPDEDTSLADYVDGLTGERIQQILANSQDTIVYAGLPKFKYEFSTSLKDTLTDMGITDAFIPGTADFSAMGVYKNGDEVRPLSISDVIHKTFIEVGEQGTRAGAATMVEMLAGCAFIEDPKEVVLDRPFVYMLIDCESQVPIFIGTLNSIR